MTPALRGKKTRFIFLLLLVWVTAGCGGGGGISGLLTFGIPLDIEEQTIQGYAPDALQVTCNPNAQGSGNLGPDTITPISFSLRDSEELRGQSFVRFARVELERVTLTILIPHSQEGQTWDFVDSISIFADDPATPEPPVLIAKLDPVPRGITQMVIPGTGVDISDIASQDRFTVSGTATGRPPCADVHFNGEADFTVSLS
jgi:hypothetical protein